MDKPARTRTRGTDPWLTIGRARFSVWDRWFLTLLVTDHSGAWDALRETIRANRRVSVSETADTEAKLSHLTDLERRWAGLDAGARDQLERECHERGLLRRARSKVQEQYVEDHEKTPAMRDTPRVRLRRRALRGHWDRFPVSPEEYEPVFAAVIEARDFFTERATFGLVKRLEATLDRESRRATRPAERVALLRAFLTALVAAMDRADDSCGALGDLAGDRIPEYFKVPWAAAGIEPELYYQDFLEYAVWEDYALLWRRLGSFHRAVKNAHFDLVNGILRDVRAELTAANLDHQAERALTLRGELHVAKHRYKEFAALALEMGSREWERITTMAEVALQAGQRAVTLSVFEAADQPGTQRDYLRDTRWRLLGRGRLPSRAPLRLVR